MLKKNVFNINFKITEKPFFFSRFFFSCVQGPTRKSSRDEICRTPLILQTFETQFQKKNLKKSYYARDSVNNDLMKNLTLTDKIQTPMGG